MSAVSAQAKYSRRSQRWSWALMALLACVCPAQAQELGEYRLKAAFLYNFALFAEWPSEVGNTLHLCVQGTDQFGAELDALQGKAVGARRMAVQVKSQGDFLEGCHMVFVGAGAMNILPSVLENLRGRPVLTVADSTNAVQRGVALNMSVQQGKIVFQANVLSAKTAGIKLSSKLLRLATEVIQ